jgi:hypothetical protein
MGFSKTYGAERPMGAPPALTPASGSALSTAANMNRRFAPDASSVDPLPGEGGEGKCLHFPAR